MTVNRAVAGGGHRRILVIGPGNSGTTALYSCVLRSAERHHGVSFKGLFEPKSAEAILELTGEHAISKVLVERFRDFPGESAKPDDAAAIVAVLMRKEADPRSISVCGLYRTAAPLLGKSESHLLDAWRGSFLGFAILREFDIPGKNAWVRRTATHGNWINWFLDEDYEFLVQPARKKLKRLGYPNIRPSGMNRVIVPGEISEYLNRVLSFGAVVLKMRN